MTWANLTECRSALAAIMDRFQARSAEDHPEGARAYDAYRVLLPIDHRGDDTGDQGGLRLDDRGGEGSDDEGRERPDDQGNERREKSSAADATPQPPQA